MSSTRLRALTVAAAFMLLLTACTESRVQVDTGAPLIESISDEPDDRTTTSIGLVAGGSESPDGALAYADEDRIPVPASDPAIEPFVFFASELGTGEEIDGLDLYRGRPTLITFSVPTCPVCTAEAPMIAGAAEKYPDITFVIVHSQGTLNDYKEFADTADLTQDNVIHLVDQDMSLWRRFGVVQQPTSVLINAEGKVSQTRGALASEGLDIVAAMLELREAPSFDHLSPDRPTNPDA